MMEAAEYVTDAPVATSVHLALSLRKPLLIEGHAGVGKTEVAKVMSRVLSTNLIRLQCYEGLDASTALYEWNYQQQLLHIKLAETAPGRSVSEQAHEIFSEPFLLRRPLLQAISQERQPPVLLIDEVDRAGGAARRPPRRGARQRDARLRAQGRRGHQAFPGRSGALRPDPVRPRPAVTVPSRDLGRAMIRFSALLRREGLPVTLSQTTDGARALEVLDVGDRDELRHGLRTVFIGRPEEVPAFDRCFDTFWRQPSEAEAGLPGLVQPTREGEDDAAPSASTQKREALALETWGTEEESESDEPLGVPAVSDQEALTGRDFSTFTPDQLDEVYRLTVQTARRLARRLSRRRRPVARRGRVDLRRTLRANLSRGDLIDLKFRRRKRRKVRLVLLCDVSGSMDLYSRFLLQFLFALQNVFERVETFTFSTRLTRVSDHLKGRSYRQVLRRLTDVRDWSGGTRIGESLAQFNREWSRVVDRRTIVIVLSDGWDTGEPDLLAGELLRIKRRAGRVIWLNPLLGNPSYEPLTRGMAAALPLVDDFAAAHNLASLRDLAARLTL